MGPPGRKRPMALPVFPICCSTLSCCPPHCPPRLLSSLLPSVLRCPLSTVCPQPSSILPVSSPLSLPLASLLLSRLLLGLGRDSGKDNGLFFHCQDCAGRKWPGPSQLSAQSLPQATLAPHQQMVRACDLSQCWGPQWKVPVPGAKRKLQRPLWGVGDLGSAEEGPMAFCPPCCQLHLTDGPDF